MENLNQVLDRGQQQNAASFGPKFKVIRFYLDVAKSRYTNGSTDHVFGSGIKSFWVCNTNNRNFVANIVPNYRSDRKENSGLPLRYNMNQKFSEPINDACLEFAAQSGVWVDVAYSESEDISIGSSDISLTGSVSPDEGATYSMAKFSASLTPAVLLPASTSRLKAVLQHKGGGSIWIGSAADLALTDYQNICLEISPGSLVEWWSKGVLYFRDDSATGILSATSFTA
jgi:hypothetical protein